MFKHITALLMLALIGLAGWQSWAHARGYLGNLKSETRNPNFEVEGSAMVGAGLRYAVADDQQAVGGPRFVMVKLMVDSGDVPLAAYQLQFKAVGGGGGVKIVGIEGGTHRAYAEPPYYDPKAIQQERAIIAAFNTAGPNQLPTGKTHIASIHLMIEGNAEPHYLAELVVASDTDGQTIPATLTYESTGTP